MYQHREIIGYKIMTIQVILNFPGQTTEASSINKNKKKVDIY